MPRSDMVHMSIWVLSGIRADKIPEIVMGGLCLREPPVWFLFSSMDQVREFHCILNKEYGNVIADQVPIAFTGVELYRKAPDISGQIKGAFVSQYSGKAHERRSLFPGSLKQVGAGEFSLALVVFEIAVNAKASGMHHTFGNPLVVKMKQFLPKHLVFQQGRAAGPGFQRVLVI